MTGQLFLPSSWPTGAPRKLRAGSEFDPVGDLCIEVLSAPTGETWTWINRDQARDLRDHLNELLGETVAPLDEAVIGETCTTLQACGPSQGVQDRVAAYDAVTRRLDAAGGFMPDGEKTADAYKLLLGDA